MAAPADPRRSLAALIVLGIANHSVLAGSRVAVSLAALGLPGPHPAAAALPRGAFLELLWHPTLRRVFAINALLAMAWDLHTVFVPIFGARIGLTAFALRTILSSFAAATFVIRFAMPWLARRLREQQVLAAALLVGGGVYLLFPFARSVGPLAALSFCLGLVFGALGATVGVGPVFWSVGAGLAASGLWSRRHRQQAPRHVASAAPQTGIAAARCDNRVTSDFTDEHAMPRLLPREGKFLDFFNQHAALASAAGAQLQALRSDLTHIEPRARAIERNEKQSGRIAHDTLRRLHQLPLGARPAIARGDRRPADGHAQRGLPAARYGCRQTRGRRHLDRGHCPGDRMACTGLGVPVSTTHTITGAIAGVGAVRKLSAVRWGGAGRIDWAWVFTIPCAAFIAALAWWAATVLR